MKTNKTFLILTAAATLSVGSAFAADSDSTDTNAAPPPPPHRQGPPPPPEMRAYHEKVLAIYDVNKDGALDEDERDVLRADVEAGKFPPPPRMAGGRGAGHPGGRMGPPPPEILARYDADKNGKLDDTERAALEKDIADGKLPPPRHRGPRGPHAGEDAPPPPPPSPADPAPTN
jgi:hypothetical protein